ncbi:MAG: hypothetical protein P8P74_03510 [Crocinitomicaceae bacterium]|nr:hypothetical protein [Crocinitomicaceae bacterium]
MKKNLYSFIGLFVVFFVTSSTIKTPESERFFEKIIFVEFSANEDSVLFQPYSKAWNEGWNRSSDIYVNGTELMNAEKYKSSFDNHEENLYTILHPMIISGEIQSYSPMDPESYGFGASDGGELRYPIGDTEKNVTFLTSENVRDELCYLLGKFGPLSDIPLVDEFGDPMQALGEDDMPIFVYPPPDYFWHSDKDLIKYKLRVSVLFNKKGKEKQRTIKAISPVVNEFSETGEVIDERELFWLNFEELESTLEAAHFFDENLKSVTYSKYLQEKVKNASIR